VRVIIAEDVGLYREMLRETLRGYGVDVAGLAATVDEAIALVDAEPPDLVLLDIRMPPTWTDEGLRAAVRIRANHPGLPILLLSNYGEVGYAVRLVHDLDDAVGYLLKERTASASDLLDAIRRVTAGGVLIDPDVVARMIRRRRVVDPLDQLTERERETLALVAEGLCNAAVARRMRIAASTMEKHVASVFRKLAITADDNARVRAVLAYLRWTGRIDGGPDASAERRVQPVDRRSERHGSRS